MKYAFIAGIPPWVPCLTKQDPYATITAVFAVIVRYWGGEKRNAADRKKSEGAGLPAIDGSL